ncbi:hypothetical protein QN372_16615 [Undibacterium sp. RTI2.1]|uniref:hypothetical protein n=1 Tax=unclassified Undibacterium TaxID=2630295 RepID=UPI002B227DB6|nr:MULTISPECIES: hypothetical protein [unclassified Undibacterium]MEB0032378.1 hypothetical protein [Undibacterium sp. RTI2.1]
MRKNHKIFSVRENKSLSFKSIEAAKLKAQEGTSNQRSIDIATIEKWLKYIALKNIFWQQIGSAYE